MGRHGLQHYGVGLRVQDGAADRQVVAGAARGRGHDHAVGPERGHRRAVDGPGHGHDAGDRAPGEHHVVQCVVGPIGAAAVGPDHRGLQHISFIQPRVAVEVEGKPLHGFVHLEFGHEPQPAHVDSHDRNASRAGEIHRPEDSPVATDRDHQIGVLSPRQQSLQVLGGRQPAILR